MLTHIVEGAGAGTVVLVTIIRLIAYAIDDEKRWPRFRNLALFVVFLLLAIAAAACWWLLGTAACRSSCINSARRASHPPSVPRGSTAEVTAGRR